MSEVEQRGDRWHVVEDGVSLADFSTHAQAWRWIDQQEPDDRQDRIGRAIREW